MFLRPCLAAGVLPGLSHQEGLRGVRPQHLPPQPGLRRHVLVSRAHLSRRQRCGGGPGRPARCPVHGAPPGSSAEHPRPPPSSLALRPRRPPARPPELLVHWCDAEGIQPRLDNRRENPRIRHRTVPAGQCGAHTPSLPDYFCK